MMTPSLSPDRDRLWISPSLPLDLSIVVPIHNEFENLPRLLD